MSLTTKEFGMWEKRIMHYEDLHKDINEKYRKYIQYYKGEQYEMLGEGVDKIVYNIILPNTQIMLSALNIRNPFIHVSARNIKSEPTQRVLETGLNYFWRELKIKKKNKKILYDALIMGLGLAKVGYHTEFSYGKRGDDSNEFDETIKNEYPWLKRWSPMNFCIAPGADSIEEAPWCMFKLLRYKEDVINDFNYDKSVAKKLNVEYSSEKNKQDESGSSIKSDEDYTDENGFVALYEVWDKRTDTIMVFGNKGKDLVSKPIENPYDLEGFPVAMLSFNDVPEQFLPISDVKIYEKQQIEINKIRSHILGQIKRMNRKYGVNMTKVYKNTLKELKAGVDGAIVKCKDTPLSVVQPLQESNVPNDFYRVLSDMKDDVREMTGVNEYMRGGIIPGTKSATEAAIIQSGSRLRSDDRIDLVVEFMTEEARLISQLLKQFGKKDLMLKVAGQGWKEFSKENIQGEHDILLDVENALPLSKDIERAKAWDRIDKARNLPTIFNLRELAKRALILDGEKDPDKYLVQEQLNEDQIRSLLSKMPKDVLQRISGTMQQETPPEGGLPPELGGAGV